jgi:hypothetical protein
VQKLNATFGGMADLERIARHVPAPAASKPTKLAASSPQVQAAVTLSSHQTLIYLGDLFRYRAAERLDKEPDWGPAIGYYALAASLRPASGLAFHQQSVVAFEQGDHLRSTYYLYRSINVEEPHPNAVANLELQFKKITAAWQKGHLLPKHSPHDPLAPRNALLSWFIRFHSLCYTGEAFSGYDELEREVLSRAVTDMTCRSLDGLLSKMTLINMCAQATAGNQFESNPDQHKFMQSYFFFLRFNVKFYTALLEAYHDHLENHTHLSTLASKLTDLTRHLLPTLRLYSTWLLSNAHMVAAQVGDEPIQQAMHRFWHTYCKTLSLMAANFSFRELREVEYQLEEDVNAFGLKPLDSNRSRKIWLNEATGQPKPKYNDDSTIRLDITQEMLGRIRELLFDALLLAVDQEVPITFDGLQFVHQDSRSADGALAYANVEVASSRPSSIGALPVTAPAKDAAPERSSMAATSPAPITNSTKPLNREAQLVQMVDDLVGPDEDDTIISDMPEQPFGFASTTGHESGAHPRGVSPRNQRAIRSPELRTEAWPLPLSPTDAPSQRLHTVSSIWNAEPVRETSPLRRSNAHSRVNSIHSVRSPLLHSDGLSWFEPSQNAYNGDRYQSFSESYAGMQSPLLFGAGTSPWSTGPRKSIANLTPPNGQGG